MADERPADKAKVLNFPCNNLYQNASALETAIDLLNTEARALFDEHAAAAQFAGLPEEHFLAIVIGLGLRSVSEKANAMASILLSPGDGYAVN